MIPKPPTLRIRPRILGLFVLGLLVAFIGACASDGAPPASSAALASVDAGTPQTVKAAPTLEWSKKNLACKEARREAKRAARKQCTSASDVKSAKDSCECEPGVENKRKWRCSAEASYVCEGGA